MLGETVKQSPHHPNLVPAGLYYLFATGDQTGERSLGPGERSLEDAKAAFFGNLQQSNYVHVFSPERLRPVIGLLCYVNCYV